MQEEAREDLPEVVHDGRAAVGTDVHLLHHHLDLGMERSRNYSLRVNSREYESRESQVAS